MENITIRPFEEKDAGPLFHVINTERERLRIWLPFVNNVLKEEDVRDFIKKTLLKNKDYYLAVLYESIPQGLTGLRAVNKSDKRADIIYWLSSNISGRGIMTSAVHQLLEHGFKQMDLNRIQIRASVNNLQSRRLAERLGFTFEGIERDGELLLDGFTDLAVYSMLKKEYQIKKPT